MKKVQYRLLTMSVNKKMQIGPLRHIKPQRGLIFNPHVKPSVRSGSYCTFFVGAGGFAVAPKLKLHLQKLGDLWPAVFSMSAAAAAFKPFSPALKLMGAPTREGRSTKNTFFLTQKTRSLEWENNSPQRKRRRRRRRGAARCTLKSEQNREPLFIL